MRPLAPANSATAAWGGKPMRIYLVRHGKNSRREIDPGKGLSGKGRREVTARRPAADR